MVKLRYSAAMRLVLTHLASHGGSGSAVELANLCYDARKGPEERASRLVRAQVRRSVKRALRSLEARGDVALRYGQDPGYISSSRNWRQEILHVDITAEGRRRVEFWSGREVDSAMQAGALSRLLSTDWDG